MLCFLTNHPEIIPIIEKDQSISMLRTKIWADEHRKKDKLRASAKAKLAAKANAKISEERKIQID